MFMPLFNNSMSKCYVEKFSKMSKKEINNLRETDRKMLCRCNHRNIEGASDSLVEDPMTGELKCNVCERLFKPVDPSTNNEDVKKAIRDVKNIVETIKILGCSDKFVTEHPEIYEISYYLDFIEDAWEDSIEEFKAREASMMQNNSIPGYSYNPMNFAPDMYPMFSNLNSQFAPYSNYNLFSTMTDDFMSSPEYLNYFKDTNQHGVYPDRSMFNKCYNAYIERLMREEENKNKKVTRKRTKNTEEDNNE